MARQNFLQGGYIGRLGDTIGQRYHDKWYVRSYNPGTDPNTPAQQAARDKFRRAGQVAQACLRCTGGLQLFVMGRQGEYAQMMSHAMLGIVAGRTGSDLCLISGAGTGQSIDFPIVFFYDSIAREVYVGALPFDDSDVRPTGLAFCVSQPASGLLDGILFGSSRQSSSPLNLPGVWLPGVPTPFSWPTSPSGYGVCFSAPATPRSPANWYSIQRRFDSINSYCAVANYQTTAILIRDKFIDAEWVNIYRERYNAGVGAAGTPSLFAPYAVFGVRNSQFNVVTSISVQWAGDVLSLTLIANAPAEIVDQDLYFCYLTDITVSVKMITDIDSGVVSGFWIASRSRYESNIIPMPQGRANTPAMAVGVYTREDGEQESYLEYSKTYWF